jgi:hypothetical protein
MDGLDQTVWNFGRFCPNRPEIHLATLHTGRFKTIQKKQSEMIPDGFLAFLDGLKPSRIWFFLVVTVRNSTMFELIKLVSKSVCDVANVA